MRKLGIFVPGIPQHCLHAAWISCAEPHRGTIIEMINGKTNETQITKDMLWNSNGRYKYSAIPITKAFSTCHQKIKSTEI